MISIPRTGSSRSLDMNAEGRKIAPERVIKHPLQDQWTLWYFENDRSKTKWEDMQNRVTTFNTVEDFWCLINHIVEPSSLRDLNDYSLFKRDIRPMWEDQANYHGGRWILNISRQTRQPRRSDLDETWLNTMLYIIGGTSQFADDINGAVVNVRSRGDKIAIWTATHQNNHVINGIGLELKKFLGTEAKITFEAHHTAGSNTGRSKPLFVL